MSDGIVVPGKFGTPTQRARGALSQDLAQLIVPYLNDLGMQTVATDLLNVAASLIAQASDKPVQDLTKASLFIAKFDWRRAKRMYFAAQRGIRPEDLAETSTAKPTEEQPEPPNPA